MTTTIKTDANSVYRDLEGATRWYPKKSEIRDLFDKVSANAPPRIDDIVALRAVQWPAGERPARVILNSLTTDGDGGGVFRWVSDSTATEDGILVIKETITTTGRWFRDAASVQGNRTITLESLGAIGDGVADDTAAFETASDLQPLGWTVQGLGDYLISDTITIDADSNPPWQELDVARFGKLIVNGTVKATHNGVAFDLYGNQGGANGPSVYIQSLVGPGKANMSSIGFRLEAGEHTVQFGECIGFYTPVLQNGCWSSTITYSAIFNCHTGIKSQLGSNNGSTSNAVVIKGDHTGGPFMNALFPERRPLSASYGIDVDHLIGCHFDAGDVQYCQVEDDGIAVRFGDDTESCTMRAYLEGSPPYPDTGSLLYDTGHNNDFTISATLSPDNVIKAIYLGGLGGKLRGPGQRTNSASYGVLGPERGAGSIRIRPGNLWDAPSCVHDHDQLNAEVYNINIAGLSGFALSDNCSYAPLTTDLPDVNNVQAGATFTINDVNIGTAISPTFIIASAAYDRPIYVACWARLVTGPCVVAVYLQESAANVTLSKAYITQGLDVVGQWQRIDLAAIIPAGRTTFKLRLAMRTVDDAQTGGCVVGWAFPITSWQPKPWSFVNLTPPSPNIIGGNALMESIRPAKYNSTVTGAGVLDCNYAPLVRITSAAENIGVLANLSEGLTTILNDTASAVDINTATGIAAVKTITARRFVNVYKVGSSLYAET